MSSEGPVGGRSPIEWLAAAAAAVARGDDLDESLAQLLGLAAEALGASVGAAYIVDQDVGELDLAVTLGIDIETAAGAASVGPIESSESPLASATRSREPLKLADAGSVELLKGIAQAALVVPMVVRRDGIELVLGVFVLGFPGELPATEAQPIAEAIGDLGAVAIERALALSLGSERAEWFERLAHTDPLTGLANRRTFDRILEMELARASRQRSPLSLVLFEVDTLESVERAVGHAAADDVLKRVAQVLSESIRLVDTVARYGGGQFVLVAPGADGIVVAERLVASVASLAPIAGLPITISAGMTQFPGQGREADDLLDGARRALEQAREEGGGKVAVLE